MYLSLWFIEKESQDVGVVHQAAYDGMYQWKKRDLTRDILCGVQQDKITMCQPQAAKSLLTVSAKSRHQSSIFYCMFRPNLLTTICFPFIVNQLSSP